MFLEDLKKLRQPPQLPRGPKIQLLSPNELGSGEMRNASEKKKKGFFGKLFGKK
jgi:hypothetical protein